MKENQLNQTPEVAITAEMQIIKKLDTTKNKKEKAEILIKITASKSIHNPGLHLVVNKLFKNRENMQKSHHSDHDKKLESTLFDLKQNKNDMLIFLLNNPANNNPIVTEFIRLYKDIHSTCDTLVDIINEKKSSINFSIENHTNHNKQVKMQNQITKSKTPYADVARKAINYTTTNIAKEDQPAAFHKILTTGRNPKTNKPLFQHRKITRIPNNLRNNEEITNPYLAEKLLKIKTVYIK
ncbi:hypothetical protein HK096_008304, partial [Nowakowskiella sp. JEL0078]